MVDTMESIVLKDDIYFREYEPYSKKDILKRLDENKDVFEKLKKSSLIDIKDGSYKFKFVGMIIIGNFLIKCYPKYIDDEKNIADDFRLVLNGLKKYNKFDGEFFYENEGLEDFPFNLLSLMLYFIEDYFENGIYSNIQNILEINGGGEINWDKTINDTFPLIKNNNPYYAELYTRRKIDDSYNYFRLLHEFIITKCSKNLEKYDLLDIFDLTPVELSDKIFDDFGGKNYILQSLEKELNVEFNTRKRNLLRLMHYFISNENLFANENFLTVYGTRKYEHVWERMCSEVLDNKLESRLKKLGLEKRNPDKKDDYDFDFTLKELIEKPLWVSNDGYSKSVDTYIIDVISIYDDYFLILDAKYYDLKFYKDGSNEKIILSGQPGIESISKQYFYELMYKKFIDDFKFKKMNAFLFPSYDSQIIHKGHIELKKFSELIGLENIQIIMLPAIEITKKYLENEKITFDDFFKHLKLEK